MFTTALTWLQNNVDWLLGASNLTISLLMFVMATVVTIFTLQTSFKRHTDIVFMLSGVAIICYSLSVHRFFLGLEFLSLIMEWDTLYMWLNLNRWLDLFPTLLTIIGVSLSIAPAFAYLLVASKNKCIIYVITIVFILSLFWTFMFKIIEWKYLLEKNPNHIHIHNTTKTPRYM